MVYKFICENCKKVYQSQKKHSVFCSNKCKYGSKRWKEIGTKNICNVMKNPDIVKKISISQRLKYQNGYINPRKGKTISEATKKRISESRKGIPAWNKGKKLSKKHILNLKKNHWSTKMVMSKEWIRKALKRHPKSSLETKFENIINDLNLPYKFVGNGKVFINKKVPDFVHLNKKIAVEVYYRRHKNLFRGGCNKWKTEREKIFNEEGWKVFFFDETQVNKETLFKELGE